MESAASTVVKFTGPADIVSAIPHLVGFQPAESVVVVCLHGERQRVGLVLRHDLVPAGEAARGLVELLSWHVRRDGASSVIVAVCSEAPDTGSALPYRAFVAALCAELPDAAESLLVRGGRWFSYSCRRSCCPPEGTPIPAVAQGAAGQFAAEAAFSGQAVLADRAELEASIQPPRNPIADTARAQALDVATEEFVRGYADGGPAVMQAAYRELLDATARRWAGGSRELSGADASRLLVGMYDKQSRDFAATLALELDGDAYLPLLTELCRHADPDVAAPVCTVLAWVAYMAGHGALANVAIDQALRGEPDYEMARLLLAGLERQIPPAEVRALTRRARAELDAANGSGVAAPAPDTR